MSYVPASRLADSARGHWPLPRTECAQRVNSLVLVFFCLGSLDTCVAHITYIQDDGSLVFGEDEKPLSIRRKVNIGKVVGEDLLVQLRPATRADHEAIVPRYVAEGEILGRISKAALLEAVRTLGLA